MADQMILPTNDLAFKKLFANNQHKDIPKGFLQDFFLTGQVSANALEYIQKAVDLLKLSNFTREERAMIDALEKATQDRISREQYVEDMALEKGWKVGHEKG